MRLKHVELVTRRAQMARPAFLAHWREVHGPLAAAMPAVQRYLQCPAIDGPQAIGASSFDGIAMLWFASTQSMREGALHPSFARTREDMSSFMDEAASQSVLTQELYSFTRQRR